MKVANGVHRHSTSTRPPCALNRQQACTPKAVQVWAAAQRAPQRRARSSHAARRPGRQLLRVQCFKDNDEPKGVISTRELEEVKKQTFTLSWAGAGIFFFWQLGATKYLAEHYDLTRIPMVGASGGALAAVLAGCGVEADRAIRLAKELSVRHNIWERPLGLMGRWGKMIEKWLDELLPDDAAERCRNRIVVVVTTLPNMAQVGITDFKDKKDLINACMASAHVPFFLDYKLTRTCRGKQCVDGSFPDFFTGLNSELLRNHKGVEAVVFDYFDDRLLKRKGRMDMLEVKSMDEIRRMYELGYAYAQKLHQEGRYDRFELAEVLLQGKGAQLSEVLVPEGAGATEVAAAAAAAQGTKGAAAGTEGAKAPALAAAVQPQVPEQQPHGLVLDLQQGKSEIEEEIHRHVQQDGSNGMPAAAAEPAVQAVQAVPRLPRTASSTSSDEEELFKSVWEEAQEEIRAAVQGDEQGVRAEDGFTSDLDLERANSELAQKLHALQQLEWGSEEDVSDSATSRNGHGNGSGKQEGVQAGVAATQTNHNGNGRPVGAQATAAAFGQQGVQQGVVRNDENGYEPEPEDEDGVGGEQQGQQQGDREEGGEAGEEESKVERRRRRRTQLAQATLRGPLV